MSVGDYVRTKYGISKIISNPNENRFNIDIFKKDGVTLRCIKQKDIINSSPNIIGLIEVGDYVNGKRVTDVDTVKKKIYVEEMYYFNKKDIETVVTKEQFSTMEYKVESEVK